MIFKWNTILPTMFLLCTYVHGIGFVFIELPPAHTIEPRVFVLATRCCAVQPNTLRQRKRCWRTNLRISTMEISPYVKIVRILFRPNITHPYLFILTLSPGTDLRGGLRNSVNEKNNDDRPKQYCHSLNSIIQFHISHTHTDPKRRADFLLGEYLPIGICTYHIHMTYQRSFSCFSVQILLLLILSLLSSSVIIVVGVLCPTPLMRFSFCK